MGLESSELNKLKQRYGERPWENLTEAQRHLLTHPLIANNVDIGGSRTVWLKEVDEEGVCICNDVYEYAFGRNRLSRGRYRRKRTPEWLSAVGITTEQTTTDDDTGRLRLELPDGACVWIDFYAMKHRV